MPQFLITEGCCRLPDGESRPVPELRLHGPRSINDFLSEFAQPMLGLGFVKSSSKGRMFVSLFFLRIQKILLNCCGINIKGYGKDSLGGSHPAKNPGVCTQVPCAHMGVILSNQSDMTLFFCSKPLSE